MKKQKLLNLTILIVVCVTILLFFHYEPKAIERNDSVVNSENNNRLYIMGSDAELLDEYNMALLQKEYQALTDQEFIDAVKNVKVEKKETKATVKLSVMSVDKESNRWNITLTKDEIDLLAKILWIEARGESNVGQKAVCEVVFNRMIHKEEFKGTLEEVLSKHNQFESWDKRKTAEPTEKEYKNIQKVLDNKTEILSKDYVYFSTSPRNNNGTVKIGNHYFCKYE